MSEKSHNKGQEDAAEGKYERPYGEIEKLVAYDDEEKKMIQENQDYDKGWRHTKDQK